MMRCDNSHCASPQTEAATELTPVVHPTPLPARSSTGDRVPAETFYHVLHIFPRAEEDRGSLVNVFGHDIEDIHRPSRCKTAGLLEQ